MSKPLSVIIYITAVIIIYYSCNYYYIYIYYILFSEYILRIYSSTQHSVFAFHFWSYLLLNFGWLSSIFNWCFDVHYLTQILWPHYFLYLTYVSMTSHTSHMVNNDLHTSRLGGVVYHYLTYFVIQVCGTGHRSFCGTMSLKGGVM